MDYEPLKIRDSDPGSDGGPPGWFAFSVILAAVGLIVGFAVILGLFV